jgi:hypothetical protein
LEGDTFTVSYKNTGVTAIDLSGFDLQDKLIIAQHDGAINAAVAHYSYSTIPYTTSSRSTHRNSYIAEHIMFLDPSPSIAWFLSRKNDIVSWYKGASTAQLVSIRKASSYPGSGMPVRHNTSIAAIKIIGLPAGLPESQFVFI